jgi:hypothetical protein
MTHLSTIAVRLPQQAMLHGDVTKVRNMSPVASRGSSCSRRYFSPLLPYGPPKICHRLHQARAHLLPPPPATSAKALLHSHSPRKKKSTAFCSNWHQATGFHLDESLGPGGDALRPGMASRKFTTKFGGKSPLHLITIRAGRFTSTLCLPLGSSYGGAL